MVDQRLIDYISENLKNGFSPEEIRSQVINYGWSQQDADSAIGIAMADLQWIPPKGQRNPCRPQEKAGGRNPERSS